MSSEGSSLLFRNIPKSLRLGSEHKRALKVFAQTLSDRVAGGRPFCCLVANDEMLRQLNRDFLNADYATDVLSFPSATDGNGLGELAISVERASEQAQRYGHDLLDELRVLMLHGVLHLAGMDHERDKGKMARIERKLRFELNLPSTLTARAHK
jgi:probable rRNA maturation factor